jgi:hypothetical protein
MNKYAAVIYDRFNVVTRVEERPTRERAMKAGAFFTVGRKGWWWIIAEEEEEIEMYKAMINA